MPDVGDRQFFHVADGIYYIGSPSEDGYTPLAFYDFSSRTSRVLVKIESRFTQELSVSPDRSTILFSKAADLGSDLMMIENFQ